MEPYTDQILFYVNGKQFTTSILDPRMTLLEWLRSDEIGLRGTKKGCGEGKCGCCTVMLSQFNHNTSKVEHLAINSCLYPVCAVDGCHVTTIEGIGNANNIHPIQKTMSDLHASQCGFCTPGFIMNLYAQLRANPCITSEQLETGLDGNLCRCTGYRPILDAYKSFGRTQKTAEEASGKFICPSTGKPCDCGQGSGPLEVTFQGGSEPIFPPALKNYIPKPLKLVHHGGTTWYSPTHLDALCSLKQEFPSAALVSLTTMTKVNHPGKTILIFMKHIPELNELSVSPTGITIGSCVTLSKIQTFFQSLITQRANTERDYESSGLEAWLESLRWFGNSQTRNVATLGGLIPVGSPVSDVVPLLWAMGSTLTVRSGTTSHTIPITEKFLIAYHKVNLNPNDIIINIFIPFTRKNEFVYFYKQGRRKTDSAAIVNFGGRIWVEQEGTSWKIKEVVLVYGGMASVTKKAEATTKFLVGQLLNETTYNRAMALLAQDFPLPSTATGGMVDYRRILAVNLFYKFYLWVSLKIGLPLSEDLKSSVREWKRGTSKGTQEFLTYEDKYPISEPIKHVNSHIQVTGEAKYTDDIRTPFGTLHAAFVWATKPHAKILSINPSAALSSPGVIQFVSAKDIPGRNAISSDYHVLFAEEVVPAVGFPIGVIVADTHKNANIAAKLVVVEYQELQPVILSIDDAIKYNSYFLGTSVTLTQGDPTEAFKTCQYIIKGEQRVGGQEHLYMEPQAALAIPEEYNQWTVIGTSQTMDITGPNAARVLGISSNSIAAKVVRLGGGFGGKETRNVFISCAAVVAAHATGRPVKIVLERPDDFISTGQRERFLILYTVGFNGDGKILAVDYKVYVDSGWEKDLTTAVSIHGIYKLDNAYNIPHFRAEGFVCKTNCPNNTAFRGFGCPQALLCGEAIIDAVAHQLGLESNYVRDLNMYRTQDKIPCGQIIENDNLRRCWQQLLVQSNFDVRKKQVALFNSQNAFVKRGISCIPMKYGISYASKNIQFALLQAGALVNIYKDGSVLVTHGGVEMGQGLHTKLIQIASKELQVDVAAIKIVETASDKIPNQPPTAASLGSDMWGGAVQDACRKLAELLKPIRESKPNASFREIALEAWIKQIPLFTTGSWSNKECTVDYDIGRGNPFLYFTYGAACAEVEIDCLTGEHQVLRADLVLDIGESMNPAIDIGQIEGGFIQGYGFFILEELLWQTQPNKEHYGHMLTKNLTTYKIPSAQCVPLDLRISLLKDAPNKYAIHSSKAVGEPPLCLAASVFLAIKEAIYSAREREGLKHFFDMEAPATCERICMLCQEKKSFCVK